jgi:hypothetical protein
MSALGTEKLLLVELEVRVAPQTHRLVAYQQELMLSQTVGDRVK